MQLQDTKPLSHHLHPAVLKERLKKALKLTFEPDDWQVELISRLMRGFDGILCAGTGYGKTLVFEGLAVLGGRNQVVLIVSPLNPLEREQVSTSGKMCIARPPESGFLSFCFRCWKEW